jgi:polysaccharide deacetylase family protein (PEP-CTERM system associated)
MLNALTIDVEDYFHVSAFARYVRQDEWDSYPLRVDGSARRILEILDSFSVTATFFILGWVAERLPALIREIHRRGHEIACHGYGHELVYNIGPEAFRADIRKAKVFLEDLCSCAVRGYRAPSYSITKKSLWAFDILIEEGFIYDSSVFPVMHDIYGIPDADRFPYDVKCQAGSIKEFPLSTLPLRFAGKEYRLPIAGGGYLRLFPVSLIKKAIHKINTIERQPVVLYVHPWEIDPEQPRIKNAGLKSRFRHYINLDKTFAKINYLLNSFSFSSIQQVLNI